MRLVADLDCILTETVRLPTLLLSERVRLTERSMRLDADLDCILTESVRLLAEPPMRLVADLDCILTESVCLLAVCSFPFSVGGSTVEICCD